MKIIISPAKKMREKTELLIPSSYPVLLSKTETILKTLQVKTFRELKEIWACNDNIVKENIERLEHFDFKKSATPALLSYDGIAFQYMAPTVFDQNMLCYVEEHLRILSGFYGILKPMDAVSPYRLEMQAKIKVNECSNLYDFWNDSIYKELTREGGCILNLASKEYFKAIQKHLKKEDEVITCHFVEWKENRMITKGVYAKMARGEMVRFMAENHCTDPEDIKKFNHMGYVFDEEHSTKTDFVFYRVEGENAC